MARTCAVIAQNAARGDYTPRGLAARLGLSRRTLQRRLRAEDTSVSALIDELRSAHALQLLATPELSVEEVGDRVGFSTGRGFRKAFERWTGSTPAQVRRDMLRSGGSEDPVMPGTLQLEAMGQLAVVDALLASGHDLGRLRWPLHRSGYGVHMSRAPGPYDLLPLPKKVLVRAMWLAGALGAGRLLAECGMALLRRWRPVNERRAFAGYTPDPRDVLVCTYEKSGTNWMMQITHQLAHGGAGEFDHIHDVVPWPDGLPLPGVQHSLALPPGGRLRVIKTHATRQDVPHADHARYVVVLRDPQDVFASMYHFFVGAMRSIFAVELSPERWLELYLEDRTGLGSWCEHLASWWPERERPNVLLLTFAELKADLPGQIERIADHLEVDLSVAERAAVVERSSFSWMKDREAAFSPPVPRLRRHEVKMVRSGKSGGGQALLPPEQLARIDQAFRQRLLDLGCDAPYDQLFPR